MPIFRPTGQQVKAKDQDGTEHILEIWGDTPKAVPTFGGSVIPLGSGNRRQIRLNGQQLNRVEKGKYQSVDGVLTFTSDDSNAP
jgi:hypothetical protein